MSHESFGATGDEKNRITDGIAPSSVASHWAVGPVQTDTMR